MDFKQQETLHQRRVIIEVLEKDSDYSHNELILKSALKSLGHNLSTDKLNSELAWLEELSLITVELVGEIRVARLTARGQDVATGAAQVPGIARKGL
ncbi:MAG: hypothetical protein GXO35_07655 [Gammaproteobacteria bacterium]|nr:hypothetical protein [Gammaproteobacteria bacterium]